MKGVVLWIAPDRLSLAGATNTNESALIRLRSAESTASHNLTVLSEAAHLERDAEKGFSMGKVVVLGVFVADAAFRSDRMPRMGETVLGESFSLGPGGKGSNQAVASARIGAETHFLTRLGQDAFADMAGQVWEDAGVIAHVKTDPDSYTGAAFIYVDDATGENAIIIAPGAAARINAEDMQDKADVIMGANVFVTQLEQPLAAAMQGLQIARESGVTTILNPAPAAKLPAEMLALCDYVTPNETETEALTGVTVVSTADAEAASARLIEMGVGRPIITLGERGLSQSASQDG